MTLRFVDALDADTASDAAHYRVTVNGTAVAVDSAGYNSTTHSVTLGLPDGSLHGGDRVAVQWSWLQDALGEAVLGQTGPVTAR